MDGWDSGIGTRETVRVLLSLTLMPIRSQSGKLGWWRCCPVGHVTGIPSWMSASNAGEGRLVSSAAAAWITASIGAFSMALSKGLTGTAGIKAPGFGALSLCGSRFRNFSLSSLWNWFYRGHSTNLVAVSHFLNSQFSRLLVTVIIVL